MTHPNVSINRYKNSDPNWVWGAKIDVMIAIPRKMSGESPAPKPLT